MIHLGSEPFIAHDARTPLVVAHTKTAHDVSCVTWGFVRFSLLRRLGLESSPREGVFNAF